MSSLQHEEDTATHNISYESELKQLVQEQKDEYNRKLKRVAYSRTNRVLAPIGEDDHDDKMPKDQIKHLMKKCKNGIKSSSKHQTFQSKPLLHGLVH